MRRPGRRRGRHLGIGLWIGDKLLEAGSRVMLGHEGMCISNRSCRVGLVDEIRGFYVRGSAGVPSRRKKLEA